MGSLSQIVMLVSVEAAIIEGSHKIEGENLPKMNPATLIRSGMEKSLVCFLILALLAPAAAQRRERRGDRGNRQQPQQQMRQRAPRQQVSQPRQQRAPRQYQASQPRAPRQQQARQPRQRVQRQQQADYRPRQQRAPQRQQADRQRAPRQQQQAEARRQRGPQQQAENRRQRGPQQQQVNQASRRDRNRGYANRQPGDQRATSVRNQSPWPSRPDGKSNDRLKRDNRSDRRYQPSNRPDGKGPTGTTARWDRNKRPQAYNPNQNGNRDRNWNRNQTANVNQNTNWNRNRNVNVNQNRNVNVNRNRNVNVNRNRNYAINRPVAQPVVNYNYYNNGYNNAGFYAPAYSWAPNYNPYVYNDYFERRDYRRRCRTGFNWPLLMLGFFLARPYSTNVVYADAGVNGVGFYGDGGTHVETVGGPQPDAVSSEQVAFAQPSLDTKEAQMLAALSGYVNNWTSAEGGYQIADSAYPNEVWNLDLAQAPAVFEIQDGLYSVVAGFEGTLGQSDVPSNVNVEFFMERVGSEYQVRDAWITSTNGIPRDRLYQSPAYPDIQTWEANRVCPFSGQPMVPVSDLHG